MSIRIIKSERIQKEATSDSFNFVDLKREGQDLLSTARREADRMLSDANQTVEQFRATAQSDGFEAGYKQGMLEAQKKIELEAQRIAEERVDEQLKTALPALRTAASSLQAERDRWLVRWEQTAVKLGVVIAEKLIRRQMTSRPEIANEMIAEALRFAAGQPQLTVYLNPADLDAWGDRANQIIESLTGCADTTLIPDSLQIRGGCRIETRHGEIDARVEAMLEQIANELIDEPRTEQLSNF